MKGIMMTTLPTLYKKTSTGAIQFWTIGADIGEGGIGLIRTQYGQVDTPNPQETVDVIRTGKNAGRANATSPLEQAMAEATAKHQKQLKKGYVTTAEAAQAGELDVTVAGSISPMLAHKFAEQGHKIVYPAYGQPKLDGMRCIAIVDDGTATLWSRERRAIISAPHIVAELEARFPTGRIEFDGELYNHDMKADFERFMSLVRQKDRPHPDHKLIQYHVYDMPVPGLAWEDRYAGMITVLAQDFEYIRQVLTAPIQDETEVPTVFAAYRALGYEGLMLRNARAHYVNKRSYDLQKVKEFDDGEFAIIDIVEGRGRLMGHVGAFVCRMENRTTFEAKMSGDTGRLKEFWDDHALWLGKKLTVRYQGLTGKNNVPRFPVGVIIRDYE
jgi:DNA ligase-1